MTFAIAIELYGPHAFAARPECDLLAAGLRRGAAVRPMIAAQHEACLLSAAGANVSRRSARRSRARLA